MPTLFPHQQSVKNEVFKAWQAGAVDVLLVSPTGSGKTVIFSSVLADVPGASAAVAHRSELVSQMSLTLARNGLRHRVIGSKATQSNCATLHLHELGACLVDPNAQLGVCGVDTLIRLPADDPWLRQVRTVITDEGHHLLRENKWGKARKLFPSARGLQVTACPRRADGVGLGRHAGGVVDKMIVGPSMRDLIDGGYLSDYRIIAPTSNVDLSTIPVTVGGDYSSAPLRAAVHKSTIVGDVAANYLKFAPGALGITFAVDIETAKQIVSAYQMLGVPAALVTGDTPDLVRASILRKYRKREILQLVNVDLFGEGFDVPAVEVVSMARPTASFNLYCQQFGRALRWAEGKTHGIIIDHVCNWERHGLPDAPQVWSLDSRDRASRSAGSDAIPLRTCLNTSCLRVYERALMCCPYCNTVPAPAARSAPAQVDGDLYELDAETLAALRSKVSHVDGLPVIPHSATPIVAKAVFNRHRARQDAQASLREVMSVYGGWHAAQGRDVREAQKRFWFKYGTDVLSAQALGATDATVLRDRIAADLMTQGVAIPE